MARAAIRRVDSNGHSYLSDQQIRCSRTNESTTRLRAFISCERASNWADRLKPSTAYVISESLDESLAAKGVVFGSLERLCASQPELVRKYLCTCFDPDYDKFAALHAAFWSGGQFLYVPRGVVIDRPLHIGSVMSDGGTDTTHTLVVLDEGAEATVLHESNSVSQDAKGLHLGAVELIQKPGSHLRYVNLQEWGYKTYNFAHQKAMIDRDATLQWTLAAMGSLLSKVNQSVDLIGPGADSQVNGVMFTEGRQHVAYHTLQHHRAPSCHSDFLYKAAQQDKSRTVWRGMIKVDKVAQKTDGYQRNDNLVLSQSSRADSIPGLEIEADDVRCTHGSTTVQSRRRTNLLRTLSRIHSQGSHADDRQRILPTDIRSNYNRKRA